MYVVRKTNKYNKIRKMSTNSYVAVKSNSYKWYILVLASLTEIFVLALQQQCMPVLFKEISVDMGLNVAQIGTIWGLAALGGLLIAMLSGAVADKFGVKRTLSALCFITGALGALRALSFNFSSLALLIFLFGIPIYAIPVVGFKPVSEWFNGKQLVWANACLTLSVALGSTLASAISATVVSPLLGGWRNVLILYGILAFLLGIPWAMSRSASDIYRQVSRSDKIPLRQALSHVVHNKTIWLIGFIFFAQAACKNGVVGYLALYLRNLGWTIEAASYATAAITASSVVGVITIMLLLHRLHLRKSFIYAAMTVNAVGAFMIAFTKPGLIWLGAILIGLVWEAFMTLMFSSIMETEGIGTKYSGTAIGLVFTMGIVGNVLSPNIGNRIASVNPSGAFIFWGSLPLIMLFLIVIIRRRRGIGGEPTPEKLEDISPL